MGLGRFVFFKGRLPVYLIHFSTPSIHQERSGCLVGQFVLKSFHIHLDKIMPDASEPDSSQSSTEYPKRTTRCGFRCPNCRMKIRASSLVCIAPFWKTACLRCKAVISTDTGAAIKMCLLLILLTLPPLALMGLSMSKWQGGGWPVAMTLWLGFSWFTWLVLVRSKGKFQAYSEHPYPPLNDRNKKTWARSSH